MFSSETILIIAILAVVLYTAYRIKLYIDDVKLLETVTNRKRGTGGERRLVLSLLKYGFYPDEVFHDLYIEYSPGYYTQIDVVVLSPAGIIVFEEKDYSGWLFGSGWQKYWTQVLDYGREKHRFYNPVLQNQKHIQHLKTILGDTARGVPFIPYIIFHGNCELRDVSQIPEGVIIGYSENLINTLNEIPDSPKAQYPDIEAIRRILRQGERNGRNPEIIRRHIENIERCKSNQ